MADCLLSAAPRWVLDRYAVVVVAGELRGGREVRAKLQSYAERGGHVVITSGNVAKLPGGLADRTEVAQNTTVSCGRGRVTFLASPFGVKRDAPPGQSLRSETDHALPKPYAFDRQVRQELEKVFRAPLIVNLEPGCGATAANGVAHIEYVHAWLPRSRRHPFAPRQ